MVAAIAMKRAATFGRAPTVTDVDFAMELLGYLGDAPEDVRRWRPDVVRAAAHDYVVRRAVVDTVSTALLRLPLAELPEHLAIVREAMAGAEPSGARRRRSTGRRRRRRGDEASTPTRPSVPTP